MSNFLNRLDKVEKASRRGTDTGEQEIKVALLGNDDFDREYALFQARLKLGLVGFDERKSTIMVTTKEMEEHYEELTPGQANKIIKEYGDAD